MLLKKDVDITGGPIVSSIIKYAIPIMLGSLLQVLFNVADTMVLGNFGSAVDVAAVGATTAIVGLVVNSFVGLSGGASVVLSRAVGGKDDETVRRGVSTSMISSIVIGVLLMIVGLSLSRFFLEVTVCPEECIDGADIYLKYYFLGIPSIMVYNFGSAIIRAKGDSKNPLIYLTVSGVLNVVLNLILCIVLSEKVVAVAVATLASQTLGAVLVVIHLIRERGVCRLDIKRLSFSLSIFGRIMLIGLPGAVNGSLYSISNMQIQSAINIIGPDCMAGNTVSGNVEHIVASIITAFGTATLVFIGQNYGAGKWERVTKIRTTALVFTFTLSFVLCGILTLLGKYVFALYIPGEDAAIEYAIIRSQYVLFFYWLIALRTVLDNMTQAFGYSVLPMASSIATVLLFRVFWMAFVYPGVQTFACLMQCYVVSWILSLISSSLINLFVSRIAKSKLTLENTKAQA